MPQQQLRCCKPWEQCEGSRAHALGCLCCRHWGANIFTWEVVVRPELQWSWQALAMCLQSSAGIPEGLCLASPTALHAYSSNKERCHPPSQHHTCVAFVKQKEKCS